MPITSISRRTLVRVGAASAATLAMPVLRAQSWPEKTIELVVPFAAGTAPDVVARSLAEGMSQRLGQQIIVVSKPGAGGAIAYKYIEARQPDGYSLVLNSNSVSTCYYTGLMPFGYQSFTHLGRVCIEFPVLAVRADPRFKNLNDFVTYAKAHPGDLKVGSTSIGSHMHLTSLAFFKLVDAEITAVPFATSSHITSLLGGHLDAVVTLPGTVSAQEKAGQAKVLGTFGSQRERAFANVPTAKEQGIDFQADLWRGVAAPKGLPTAILEKLQDAIAGAVENDSFSKRGESMGFVPAYQNSATFTKTVASEDAVVAQIMKRAGLVTKS